MPTFKELSERFELLARLVELLGDSPFKARAYRFAAAKMREMGDVQITEKALKELSKEKGIGKAIVNKTKEFMEIGKIKKIEQLKEEIPRPLFILAKDSQVSGRMLHKLYCELKDLPEDEIIDALKERSEMLGLSEDLIEKLENEGEL